MASGDIDFVFVNQCRSGADPCYCSSCHVTGWDGIELRPGYLAVITRLFDHFRCHPKRRSDERVALVCGRRQLTGNTEVGEFDVSLLGQEHVCG